LKVLDQYSHGLDMLTEFLVDAEGFIEELVLLLLSNLGELNSIIVI
jgi:hypothetical protein